MLKADRLVISLALIDQLMMDESFKDWPGLGMAIQAYQKRSLAVVKWVSSRARLPKTIDGSTCQRGVLGH